MEQHCNHKPNGFQFIQPGTQKRTLEDPDNHPDRASITAETNRCPIYTTNQQSFIQYVPPACGDPNYISSTPSESKTDQFITVSQTTAGSQEKNCRLPVIYADIAEELNRMSKCEPSAERAR